MGIDNALFNGLSGLSSFSTAISVVSDNVANADTTGYKSNSVLFGDLVNNEFALSTNDKQREGSGSSILGISTDYSQGELIQDSDWSHLAVQGQGFFMVSPVTSSGTAPVYYTRDGSFHLDGQGYLVNQEGDQVQGYQWTTSASTTGSTIYSAPASGASLAPIQIQNPQNYDSFTVETDGTLVGVDSSGNNDDLWTVGLATFSNDNGLVRKGENLNTTGPEIGQTFTNLANPTLFGDINNSTLESSNVDLSQQMVDLIRYQSSYNANSKTITTADQMLNTSINMVQT